MGILDSAPGGNPPASFRALYDKPSRIVPGEERDALSQPPEGFAYNPFQVCCSMGLSANVPKPVELLIDLKLNWFENTRT